MSQYSIKQIKEFSLSSPSPDSLFRYDGTHWVTTNLVTINNNGDVTITGNLLVQGTTSTVNTENLLIRDPLILLAGTQSGLPTLDSGLMINRGSSVTQSLIWDESEDTFAFISTTGSHETSGNLTIGSYSPLRVGGLRLTNGTENIGYVLTTDNSGVASWTASSNILTDSNGIYSGSGTVSNGTTASLLGSLSFGTSLWYLDGSSQRVGINTNTPTSLFHLVTSSTSSSNSAFLIEDTTGDNVLDIRENGYAQLSKTLFLGDDAVFTSLIPNLDVVGRGIVNAQVATRTTFTNINLDSVSSDAVSRVLIGIDNDLSPASQYSTLTFETYNSNYDSGGSEGYGTTFLANKALIKANQYTEGLAINFDETGNGSELYFNSNGNIKAQMNNRGYLTLGVSATGSSPDGNLHIKGPNTDQKIIVEDNLGADIFNIYNSGTVSVSTSLEVQNKFQYQDGNQANGYLLISDSNGVATWTSPTILSFGLNYLNDVTITGATTGQTLHYNGTNWVNQSDLNISNSGDVGIGTASNPSYSLHVGGDTKINGTLFAASKSFDIPHPSFPDKRLRYGSLEGPEYGVYYRGTLKQESQIILPEYWLDLVHKETITVQLTAIGRGQQLYVNQIIGNVIEISTEDGQLPHCYYVVYGERKDINKIITEY